MKYEWTDWITHVPGQQLPIGTHGIFEHKISSGEVTHDEGTIGPAQRDHQCWFMTDEFGLYAQLTRYKLRYVVEEQEAEVEIHQLEVA